MADTFLVGIDGSECCSRAVDFAAVHAKHAGARLIVAYVIEWSPFTFNTPEENELRHKRREEELARARSQVLEPVLAELKQAGVTAEGAMRHGHAAETLAQLAEEHKASQIFIGRRGVSKLQALLFGSVAGSLVQISPIPVTVVP